jgi:acyl-CoA thioester hydrolase
MPVQSPFRTTQRVYFDDLDALNILHNVRFLLFMERARGELLNALGFRWADELADNPDQYHVVAAHDVRYVKPVRGEGDVLVEITPVHLGHSSLILESRVRSMHGDTVFAECRTRLVRLDPTTDAPCSWSDRFRSAVEPMIPAADR